jgi:hypothetical protein
MVLEMPRSATEIQVIPVSITAPGEAKVTKMQGSSDDKIICINLDTYKLLTDMIHQASRVVAAVVDVANTASIVPESKLCRSSSFLAMPPPQAKARSKNPKSEPSSSSSSHGLDLLGKAAAELPIVSPDMSALKARMLQVPSFNLVSEAESETESEHDLSDLSPDQCADIVDGIFGEFDDAILEPPTKRNKVDHDHL